MLWKGWHRDGLKINRIWRYSNIYIYCHSQTNCFIESQHFSVARYVRCFKLGSKTGWIYVSRMSYPKAIVPLDVNPGILHLYLFTNSLIGYRSAQLTRRALHLHVCGRRQFPTWVLLPSIYIYFHPQKDCFVVSLLFSVTRQARCFKLGLKVCRISNPKAIITA